MELRRLATGDTGDGWTAPAEADAKALACDLPLGRLGPPDGTRRAKDTRHTHSTTACARTTVGETGLTCFVTDPTSVRQRSEQSESETPEAGCLLLV